MQPDRHFEKLNDEFCSSHFCRAHARVVAAPTQCAVKPPSTGKPTPITKLAAGLHSHSTAAATSSARPRRPIDCCFMISAIASA
jgi:hypothetical protein